MVRATLLFPAKRGARFDWAFYAKDHPTFVKTLIGPQLKRVELARTRGTMGGIPTTFTAVSQFYFENSAEMESAMARVAPKLLENVAKFTDIAPQIVLDEVL